MKHLPPTTYKLPPNQGFTLLELIVVLGLVSLLAGIAMPTYNQMKQNVALTQYSAGLVNALRVAQNRSIISQGGIAHGVHLAADGKSFVIIGSGGQATYQLGNGVEIIQGKGTDIMFNRLTGAAAVSTTTIGFPSGKLKTIVVTPLGSIKVN